MFKKKNFFSFIRLSVSKLTVSFLNAQTLQIQPLRITEYEIAAIMYIKRKKKTHTHNRQSTSKDAIFFLFFINSTPKDYIVKLPLCTLGSLP